MSKEIQVQLICDRCGIEFEMGKSVYEKRKERGNENARQCKDCFTCQPKIDYNELWENIVAANPRFAVK